MPAPKSTRGIPITSAAFEAAPETAITRYGVKGLNITDQRESLEADELSVMVNLTHRQDFGVTPRPGQLSVYSGLGTEAHSIRRLYASDSSYVDIIGADTNLKVGTTTVDTGYSGDPLSLLPYRTFLTAESWMYVGDSSRMRRVRADGTDLAVGLPPPSNAATTSLAAENKTSICTFSSTDGTQASAWTAGGGRTLGNEFPVLTPYPPSDLAAPFPASPTGWTGNLVEFETAISSFADVPDALNGFFEYWGMPLSRNLSTVGGVTASDDDYIHLWINLITPSAIAELRVYLVCSETFSTSALPGSNTGANGDAYMKSFTAADFQNYIAGTETQTTSAEKARQRSLRDQDLKNRGITIAQARKDNLTSNSSLNITLASTDTNKQTSLILPAGVTLIEEGRIGVPLKRGDFQRIGNTTGRDWATITGMIVMVTGNGTNGNVYFALSDMYMTGGSGPDTGDAADSPYDYRYTHYDTRTGDEGNPSPIQSASAYLDSLRRTITVTPTAYGDASVHQRVYRRGGTAPTDWYFVGENASDGGAFSDDITDTDALASATLEDDNDQPISTVNASGTTVLAQPLPAIWGPQEDLLFGCGDPYRAGDVYFCKPGHPGSWPPDNHVEVCSTSERLVTGCMYGGQSFVFSEDRAYYLYPNLTGDATSITVTPTQCKRGVWNRQCLAVGLGGMYFVNKDGIYRTVGGPEEWLSRKIDPIFRGQFKGDMLPVAVVTHPDSLSLEIHENELYFNYQDQAGDSQTLVYSIPYGYWRQYTYGKAPSTFYSVEGTSGSVLYAGGRTTGKVYSIEGLHDDGTAIACTARTGILNFGRPRMEKLLTDQALDVDTQGVEMTLTNRLLFETVTNPSNDIDVPTGRKRIILDNFGSTPQRAENISTEISWSSATAAPVLYWMGISTITEPELTVNRATQWEDLQADESYLMGVTFDCDTGGQSRTIIVEYDFGGAISTAATLTVLTDGRHKVKFSWAAVQAHKVRIRPNDDCLAWILYKVDWIANPEPPRIARWDTHFENSWDQYVTGCDLYCDTGGVEKTIEFYVDGTLIKTEAVTTNGRLVHHVTFNAQPPIRGHVLRFVATDNNQGLLYDYRWQREEEPSEQTNWNQNLSIEGMEADKYLKAIMFQCDTYGQDKTVDLEIDGVVRDTITVNADGRQVVEVAFPQLLGRVFRFYPTDDNPGRLYSVVPQFDLEPFCLDRWETQEITHGMSSWHYPIYGHITLKTTADVELEVIGYNQSGLIMTDEVYAIPTTAGLKQKVFVPFVAGKAVLYKYILTSDTNPFWLYREETDVMVREWGTDRTAVVKPFGNDALDLTRTMTKSSLAAARSGGGTA